MKVVSELHYISLFCTVVPLWILDRMVNHVLMTVVVGVLALLGGAAADWQCMGNHTAMKSWHREMDYAIDREELVKLAHTMDFDNWPSKRNWLSDSLSFCDWECICCEFDGTHNRLTEIHLERNNLKGSFSESFTRAMTRIKVLNFHLNAITGFPPQMETYLSLEQVKFGRNPICGKLPLKYQSLTKLVKFNCNFCCLSGPFPDLFGNMTSLEETYWDGNNFTGSIPPSVGALKSLTKISFNLNSFTGTVPESLCHLPSLDDCRIGSDTKFKPYDDSPGHPERKWLLKWNGNKYSCPVSSCILNGVCNSKTAGPVPSPVKCNN